MLNEQQFGVTHGVRTSAEGFDNPTPPVGAEDRLNIMKMMRTASEEHATGPEGIQLRGWGLNAHGKHWAHLQVNRETPSQRVLMFHSPETGEVKQTHTWTEY